MRALLFDPERISGTMLVEPTGSHLHPESVCREFPAAFTSARSKAPALAVGLNNMSITAALRSPNPKLVNQKFRKKEMAGVEARRQFPPFVRESPGRRRAAGLPRSGTAKTGAAKRDEATPGQLIPPTSKQPAKSIPGQRGRRRSPRADTPLLMRASPRAAKFAQAGHASVGYRLGPDAGYETQENTASIPQLTKSPGQADQ